MNLFYCKGILQYLNITISSHHDLSFHYIFNLSNLYSYMVIDFLCAFLINYAQLPLIKIVRF